jgi:hypothetical protein
MDWDLRAHLDERKSWRKGRIAVGLIALGGGVLTALEAYWVRGWTPHLALTLIPACVFFAAAAVILYQPRGSTIIRLGVNANGISFVRLGGKEVLASWPDPRLLVWLWDKSKPIPNRSSHESKMFKRVWEINLESHFSPLIGTIPKDAFDDVLGAARRHHLNISVMKVVGGEIALIPGAASSEIPASEGESICYELKSSTAESPVTMRAEKRHGEFAHRAG